MDEQPKTTNGMQSLGAVLFLTAIGLLIYAYFTATAGAFFLGLVAFGAALGAFASGVQNERKQQLDRIERNQGQ